MNKIDFPNHRKDLESNVFNPFMEKNVVARKICCYVPIVICGSMITIDRFTSYKVLPNDNWLYALPISFMLFIAESARRYDQSLQNREIERLN